MLYLDIQKVKEAMKVSDFKHDIVGTTSCMKIIVDIAKGCGRIPSNETLFDYIWFREVKTAQEKNQR